jgi:hypothetical protein
LGFGKSSVECFVSKEGDQVIDRLGESSLFDPPADIFRSHLAMKGLFNRFTDLLKIWQDGRYVRYIVAVGNQPVVMCGSERSVVLGVERIVLGVVEGGCGHGKS